ncbi:serine/threonine-protein kinase [Arthrobacter sp. ISL-69]|uniref:serine/threonine-protein kinase n=1 Tax=Arthrobacter sp. ISL-69 TaxID=2819113 RepID=UPI001BEC7DCC|nr:serine/threonine-protein kinase [Arthrobacter sp. ISL-69]MBT2536884.1 serine/threonine protein kinase [Arthrobacter sp. ISL-69]
MSSKRPVAPPPPIPGFTYISLLGSGGFSDVYLYEQDRPRRKVAVKVLLSDLKTEGARRRFESEANLMAQLSSHPYIVTIFEAEVTKDGHSYLAMEYCSRPSLDVRYRRQRFSVDEVLAVGIQVASAVETAHRAGIAHRDIKPANILVTDYNRPALTDFGISGTLGSDADEDAGMSIPWSPPEQFRDGPVDGVMVDVWALGATLYTLLAGRSPFVLPGADNSQRELISRITNSPVPQLGRADVPESLELALSTAMAKSAVSRYSSAHAFALALQRTQAELNLSVTPFEVLEEAHGDDSHPDDGFEETRVRSIASVDPDQTGHAPTFPARARPVSPSGFTSVVPSAPPAGPAPGPAPTSPGPAVRPDQHDDWAQGTMLRGSLAAAPQAGAGNDVTDDATVHRGSPAQQGGWQGGPAGRDNRSDADIAATVNRPQPAREVTAEASVDHPKRNLWLSVAGAAVLAVAVVVGIVLASSAAPKPVPTEAVSKPPADPLDSGTVPEVEGLAAERDEPDGRFIVFRWSNPQPKQGDTYKWRTRTAQSEGTYETTLATNTFVSGLKLPVCVQVIIVRADGSASPGGPDSIACLDS